MSSDTKINQRYEKLKEMQQCYENSQLLNKFRNLLAMFLVFLAWFTTLFLGFSAPFFFLQFMGTSLYLYNYISMNISKMNDSSSLTNYLFDPLLGLLSIITVLCGWYSFISIKRCQPY